MEPNRTHRAAAWLAVLGIPALLLAWDAVGQRGFARFHDNAAVYAPLRLEVGRQWAEGRLPFWNPYKRAGSPLLADSVSAALYPPNLIFAASREGSQLGALEVVAALHHLLAAAAAYVFLRTLRLTRLPAVAGALVYALNGFSVVVAAKWIALQNALVWAPLVLACLERTRRSGRFWLWAALGAAVYAVQLLAGYPEFSFYTGLLVASYALMMILRDPARWQRPIAAALLIGVGGVLLAAPQLLPSLAAYAESTRPLVIPYRVYVWSSARPIELLSAGLPAAALPLADVFAVYQGTGLLYAGAPALAFAGAALRRLDALTIWAALAVALGLLLVLGEHSPVGAIAYSVPGFSSFRWPFKHSFEVTVGLSVLTALGMQRFVRGEPGTRIIVSALLVAIAGLGLVAPLLATPVSRGPAIVHGGAALVLACFALAARPRLSAGLALGALVLGLAWNRDTALDRIGVLSSPPADAPSQLVDRLRAEPGARFLYLQTRFSRSTFSGDRPTAVRIPAVHGAGPFLWRPLADALAMSEIGVIATPGALRPGDRRLDLLGVRHVVSPRKRRGFLHEGMLGAQPGARFEELSDALLVTRATALPFAYVVDRVAYAAHPSIDPGRTAVIARRPDEPGRDSPTSEGRVALRRFAPGLVELDAEIDGPGPGFLVLSQPDYPGWSATVDGEALPIRRVHGLVQGIWLAPGQHAVRFRYRAPGFVEGLILACATLPIFAFLIRRERSRPV